MPYSMTDVVDATAATDDECPISKDGGDQTSDNGTPSSYQSNGTAAKYSTTRSRPWKAARPTLERNKKSQEKGIRHAMKFLCVPYSMTDVVDATAATDNECPISKDGGDQTSDNGTPSSYQFNGIVAKYSTTRSQPSTTARQPLKRNKKSQKKGIRHAMKFLYGWEDGGEEGGNVKAQGPKEVGKEK
ncbi:Protein of unknown function [Pyronema omphalodes CBS 100304]|uniref:Uncharacterized protein n=1 Tax=Pyronema omphalodes (strain CBS 100304) TaxID=1076935 RepID=U4L9Y3_PYROM|nr:Protein of unknown function [Pyronema omphalodes CBS 100304]